MTELSHVQEIVHSLCMLINDPESLPVSTENLLADMLKSGPGAAASIVSQSVRFYLEKHLCLNFVSSFTATVQFLCLFGNILFSLVEQYIQSCVKLCMLFELFEWLYCVTFWYGIVLMQLSSNNMRFRQQILLLQ